MCYLDDSDLRPRPSGVPPSASSSAAQARFAACHDRSFAEISSSARFVVREGRLRENNPFPRDVRRVIRCDTALGAVWRGRAARE